MRHGSHHRKTPPSNHHPIRRVVKKVENSGDWDCTYVYYYDGQKLIETHNGSEQVIKQHLWGLQYIDELLQIAVNDDPADTGEDDCETVYFACPGANFNVLGIVDDAGELVERYEYTPYGQRMVFVNSGTNDTDTSAPVLESTRAITAGSITQPYGLNEVGHQGLLHDKETTLIYNRARMHHPRLARFMQRDPLGYVDGMSSYASYQIVRNGLDPYGEEVTFNQDEVDLGPQHYRDDGEYAQTLRGVQRYEKARIVINPYGCGSRSYHMDHLAHERLGKSMRPDNEGTVKLAAFVGGIVNNQVGIALFVILTRA